jgi:hypothetical protein
VAEIVLALQKKDWDFQHSLYLQLATKNPFQGIQHL